MSLHQFDSLISKNLDSLFSCFFTLMKEQKFKITKVKSPPKTIVHESLISKQSNCFKFLQSTARQCLPQHLAHLVYI